jgi:hypothetical protein
VVSHRWFSKYFKPQKSLNDGVSAVSQSRSPKSTFGGRDTNIILRELPIVFSDSLKKKEEIEILYYRVAYALNSIPQSRFSDSLVGCVVSPFYTQDNHTPTISNTTEISGCV